MERSKELFWVLIDIFIGVAVLVALVSGYAVLRQAKSLYPSRNISVAAEGKVVVSPDIATLSFSVVSEGADPAKIQEANNVKINDAINFLKTSGVDSKDIKTAGYNLQPKYTYDEKTRRSYISGYTLTQTVFVKMRDLGKVGVILSGLPARGINEISGLTFSIEDQDKFLNEARAEAFTKAKAKAEAMAKAAGVSIKKVISFNEYGGGYPYPIMYAEKSLGMGGDAVRPATAPVIEPGSQEVTVQVTVIYEIW